MRNDERIAEELRILRAARDGRLYTNEAGRWMIDGEARPDPRARQYLGQSMRLCGRRITDEGRLTLLVHGEMP